MSEFQVEVSGAVLPARPREDLHGPVATGGSIAGPCAAERVLSFGEVLGYAVLMRMVLVFVVDWRC
jgi:hypothetical protein